MKTATCLHVFGTVVVIIACILHIVCVAVPYYSTAKLDQMDGVDQQDDVVKTLKDMKEEVNVGLYLMCSSNQLNGQRTSECKSIVNSDSFSLSWKVARYMAIIGVVLMAKVAIGSALTLIVKSRGDRLRLLPYIIFGFACAAGVVTFIADMIIASSYNDLKNDNPEDVNAKLFATIKHSFVLGWGFGLDLASVVLVLLGGFLLLIAGRMVSKEGFVV